MKSENGAMSLNRFYFSHKLKNNHSNYRDQSSMGYKLWYANRAVLITWKSHCCVCKHERSMEGFVCFAVWSTVYMNIAWCAWKVVMHQCTMSEPTCISRRISWLYMCMALFCILPDTCGKD